MEGSPPIARFNKAEEYVEEEEFEYLDETQVYLRSKFYESWLWMDVNLPSETDKDGWVNYESFGYILKISL